MLARNWGRVIFISSESAVQIPVEMIHYGVTKIAHVGLARGLAETTAGTGVTVNSVLAGPTRSEGVAGFVEAVARQRGVGADEVEREFFRTMRPSSLLRRFASPDEVAALGSDQRRRGAGRQGCRAVGVVGPGRESGGACARRGSEPRSLVLRIERRPQ